MNHLSISFDASVTSVNETVSFNKLRVKKRIYINPIPNNVRQIAFKCGVKTRDILAPPQGYKLRTQAYEEVHVSRRRNDVKESYAKCFHCFRLHTSQLNVAFT
jgi:hypothetical protein